MKNTYLKPVPFETKFVPMSLEKRSGILPARNVNSLYPAKYDTDVMVTGNGVQRIDILGDPYNDRLLFLHERVCAPRWEQAPEPPDISYIIPKVRELLRRGEFQKAAEIMDEASKKAGYDKWITDSGYGVDWPLMPLRTHGAMQMLLDFGEGGQSEDYLRYLDMSSGEIIVRCNDKNGGILRRAFVSFSRDAVIQHFSRLNGDKFNVNIRFVEPGGFDENEEALNSALLYRFNMSKPEKSDVIAEIKPDSCVISCAYNPEFGKRGYCCVTTVQTDGTAIAQKGQISISDASAVMLITRTVKYESNYVHDNAGRVLKDIRQINGTYDEMLKENFEHVSPMMDRSYVTFGGNPALSAEELLNDQDSGGELSPMLLEKLYDMGRFFMIMDTGDDPPSWGQHNINTNLQVCAGNMTGLPEVMETYFKFYESKFEDFRLNAKNLFGAGGVLGSVHCDYDTGRFYQFSKTYPHYCWTACLGWIYNEFWGHYMVTGDKDFLRDRIVPGLKEIARFYLDFLTDTDENGKVIFYPSYSPENPSMNEYHAPYPREVFAINVNSLMDIMVCREVLDNLMEACEILQLDETELPRWKELRHKLPDYLLDEDGAVKEWSFAKSVENYNHRHVSHHYDVWPGRAISQEKTPELVRPFILSNRKRAHQDDSCHGVIHRYFTAVRLNDIPDMIYNLRTLLEHGYVTRALNTMHYPYRLHCPDLQGAMPAIVLEMLVCSDEGFIKLLPAVPEDLKKGSLHGVWLYTFAKIENMEWNLDSGRVLAEISSVRNQKIRLSFPIGYKKVFVNGQLCGEDGNGLELNLTEGSITKLEFVS
jgi:alpha-L-fucosidase 2